MFNLLSVSVALRRTLCAALATVMIFSLSVSLVSCKGEANTASSDSDGSLKDKLNAETSDIKEDSGNYSKNLQYELNDDGVSYKVTTHKGAYGYPTEEAHLYDSDIVVPPTYNGLPVTVIGEDAFRQYATSIELPNTIEVIETQAFMYCDELTSVTIPDSVKIIETHAFYACENLKTVKLGNGLITLGSGAFSECYALSEVSLGNSLREIEGWVFNCASFESIVIPASVVTIGEAAFQNVRELKSITVADGNQNYVSVDGDLYSADKKTLIAYCIGKTEDSFAIPQNVETIDDYAFSQCENLKELILPNSIRAIDSAAFYRCTNLSKFVFGGNIDSWREIVRGEHCFTDIPAEKVSCIDGDTYIW